MIENTPPHQEAADQYTALPPNQSTVDCPRSTESVLHRWNQAAHVFATAAVRIFNPNAQEAAAEAEQPRHRAPNGANGQMAL